MSTTSDNIATDIAAAKEAQTIVAKQGDRLLNRADAIAELDSQAESYRGRLLEDPTCQVALKAIKRTKQRIEHTNLDKAARSAPPSLGQMFSEECAAIEKRARHEKGRQVKDQAFADDLKRTYKKYGIGS